MTPDEIRRRLSRLRPMDLAAAEALARDIGREAREPLAVLAKLSSAGDPASAAKADAVLSRLGELGIVPRLAAASALSGEARTRAIFEAYRAYRELEERVVAQLRVALRDASPIPASPDAGPVEVPAPVTRVRDEAYLLLRRLRHPDEPEDEYYRFALRHARLPEPERDGAIAASGERPPG